MTAPAPASQPLSILYVGPCTGTALQRARALASLGHRVEHLEAGTPGGSWRFQAYRVGHHLGRPPDLLGANRAILRAMAARPPDVLWIDKGRSIRVATLRRVRALSPATRLVSYSPDDMTLPGNSSPRYRAGVPYYDLHVTTKSYQEPELRALGARAVLFVDNAYDPEMHRPLELSAAERARYACDVGFIGHHEADRARRLAELARAGVPVVVRGPGWPRGAPAARGLVVEHGTLAGLAYARAINATRINLGFLRKAARDRQTTRSVEIPACGAFLLAERTDEHRRLFEEGREAEFFGSSAELIEKCRYYLAHEAERRRIAAAGLRRCREGGYDNASRLARVLAHLAALGTG